MYSNGKVYLCCSFLANHGKTFICGSSGGLLGTVTKSDVFIEFCQLEQVVGDLNSARYETCQTSR